MRDPRLALETALKAMDLMGYNALGLGEEELRWGEAVLAEVAKEVSFPFLCANLPSQKGAWRPYAVLEMAEGPRVALVAVVAPQLLPRGLRQRARDPAGVLQELVPRLRRKADLVVLLSHLGRKATLGLLRQVSGVDMAVVAHVGLLRPRRVGEAVVAGAGFRGQYVGLVDLELGARGVSSFSGRLVMLSERFGDDPKILQLVKAYRDAVTEGRKVEDPRERARRMVREMTPEEFIRYLRERQRGGLR